MIKRYRHFLGGCRDHNADLYEHFDGVELGRDFDNVFSYAFFEHDIVAETDTETGVTKIVELADGNGLLLPAYTFDVRAAAQLVGVGMQEVARAMRRLPSIDPLFAALYVYANGLAVNVKGDREEWNRGYAKSRATDVRVRHTTGELP
jgi:hypothetical protein